MAGTQILLSLFRGLQANLGEGASSNLTNEGRLYLCTDTGYLYYDTNSGKTPAVNTNRFKLNAGTADKANQVNPLYIYVNGTGVQYNGASNSTSVYIGNNIVVGGSSATANAATTDSTNKVYIKLRTQAGSSDAYSDQSTLSLAGSGDVKVYTDANGNITIRDITYTASGGITKSGANFAHSNAAITAGSATSTYSATAITGVTPQALAAASIFSAPNVTYDTYGHITATSISYYKLPAVFTGATSSVAGTFGFVPAPAKGVTGKYLKSDGTWGDPANTHYTTRLFVTGSTNENQHSTAVTNPNVVLRIKDQSGSSFTQNDAINIKGTGGTSVTAADGTISITTLAYSGGSDISVSNAGVIAHSTSVTAKTAASATADLTPGYGGSFTVPTVGYNAYGHVNGAGTFKVTLPTNPIMGKATANTGGAAGLVPAQEAGDNVKFLRGDGKWVVPTDTNTHWAVAMYLTGSTEQASNSTTVANDNVYIRLYEEGSQKGAIKLVGTGNSSVTVGAAGIITLHSPLYTFQSGLKQSGTAAGGYTIEHANTAITAGGATANTTANLNDSTLVLQTFKYDQYGHIIGTYQNTITFNKASFTAGSKTKGLLEPPSTEMSPESRYLKADGSWSTPPNTDTHYATQLVISDVQNATAHKALTNGNVILRLGDVYNSAVTERNTISLTGGISSSRGTGVTVTSTNQGAINIQVGVMGAVTESADGASGLTPAVAYSNYGSRTTYYLRADGTWNKPHDTTYNFGTWTLSSRANSGGGSVTYTGASSGLAVCRGEVDDKDELMYDRITDELTRDSGTTDLQNNVLVGYLMNETEVNAILTNVFGSA